MTGRIIAAALLPLILAGGAAAQTLACAVEAAGTYERSEEGDWSGAATEAPFSFLVTATEACAQSPDGCEASLTLDLDPETPVPCVSMGPGSGLACTVQDVVTIYLHTGSMAFTVIEVEHLIEGRRDPDVLVAVGSCAPA